MQDSIPTLENVNIKEDEEALSLCIKGKKETYGFIVKKYMKRAYFTALGLVKNHDDALFKKFSKLRNTFLFLTFLKKHLAFLTFFRNY